MKNSLAMWILIVLFGKIIYKISLYAIALFLGYVLIKLIGA